MEFENVTLSTESITLFTATGLHTFENLINLNTVDCDAYDKHLMEAYWCDYLTIECGLDDNEVDSFINDHGYVVPQDWFDTYCTFTK